MRPFRGVWGIPHEFSSHAAAELDHRYVDCAESRANLRKSIRGREHGHREASKIGSKESERLE